MPQYGHVEHSSQQEKSQEKKKSYGHLSEKKPKQEGENKKDQKIPAPLGFLRWTEILFLFFRVHHGSDESTRVEHNPYHGHKWSIVLEADQRYQLILESSDNKAATEKKDTEKNKG